MEVASWIVDNADGREDRFDSIELFSNGILWLQMSICVLQGLEGGLFDRLVADSSNSLVSSRIISSIRIDLLFCHETLELRFQNHDLVLGQGTQTFT